MSAPGPSDSAAVAIYSFWPKMAPKFTAVASPKVLWFFERKWVWKFSAVRTHIGQDGEERILIFFVTAVGLIDYTLYKEWEVVNPEIFWKLGFTKFGRNQENWPCTCKCNAVPWLKIVFQQIWMRALHSNFDSKSKLVYKKRYHQIIFASKIMYRGCTILTFLKTFNCRCENKRICHVTCIRT